MIGSWFTVPDVSEASGVDPGPDGGINQLAWLVGGTWFSVPQGSPKIVEETCAWSPDRQSILTSVIVRMGKTGPVTGRGRGSFHWDAVRQRLVAHSVIESPGTDQRMLARQTPLPTGPNQWHFEATFIINSQVEERQQTLSHFGQDEMKVDQYQLQNGEPVLMGSATYLRQAATGSAIAAG